VNKKAAVEAALNQYSLLLNGREVEHWEQQDQDGMREELHALLELMLPHLEGE